MAKAYKCDLCGRYYAPHSVTSSGCGFGISAFNGVRLCRSEALGYVDNGYVLDLCPACANKMLDFLKEAKHS